MEDDIKTKWKSIDWSISWHDNDYVKIEGPYGQSAIICGGDFESILSGLCAIEQMFPFLPQNNR